ncbi:hypothetical protein M0802_000845 [Mischocyttarus mexicanus]|nr:hypothetical protein M0802_000845 [Mischocyttarus mexicanus]
MTREGLAEVEEEAEVAATNPYELVEPPPAAPTTASKRLLHHRATAFPDGGSRLPEHCRLPTTLLSSADEASGVVWVSRLWVLRVWALRVWVWGWGLYCSRREKGYDFFLFESKSRSV